MLYTDLVKKIYLTKLSTIWKSQNNLKNGRYVNLSKVKRVIKPLRQITYNKENLISELHADYNKSVMCNNYNCNNAIALPLDLDECFRKEFLQGCWFCSKKCYRESIEDIEVIVK